MTTWTLMKVLDAAAYHAWAAVLLLAMVGCVGSGKPKTPEQIAAEQKAFIESTAHASALLADQGVKIDATLETDGNAGVAQKSEWYLKTGVAAQLRITNDPVLAAHLKAQERMWLHMDAMQAQQERFLAVIEAQRKAAGAEPAVITDKQSGDPGAKEAPAPPPDPG